MFSSSSMLFMRVSPRRRSTLGRGFGRGCISCQPQQPKDVHGQPSTDCKKPSQSTSIIGPGTIARIGEAQRARYIWTWRLLDSGSSCEDAVLYVGGRAQTNKALFHLRQFAKKEHEPESFPRVYLLFWEWAVVELSTLSRTSLKLWAVGADNSHKLPLANTVFQGGKSNTAALGVFCKTFLRQRPCFLLVFASSITLKRSLLYCILGTSRSAARPTQQPCFDPWELGLPRTHHFLVSVQGPGRIACMAEPR